VRFGELVMNNAEESLQDGSYLFSTQHPGAQASVSFKSQSVSSNPGPRVRAMINLEAAGTTGREILLQATSEEACPSVPHSLCFHARTDNSHRPFGTIFANDIFSSEFLLSEYVCLSALILRVF
jgi:hypothetical protein